MVASEVVSRRERGCHGSKTLAPQLCIGVRHAFDIEGAQKGCVQIKSERRTIRERSPKSWDMILLWAWAAVFTIMMSSL